MEKKISVVIPCYNVENLIDRCLGSLVDQTIGIENLEIILIDDFSMDNTWGKILEFESRFPDSVMAIRLEQNSRQGTARNIGIKYSSAEYITFIDSDDWIENDMLETMYASMQGDDIDLAMVGHIRDDGSPVENITSFFDGNKKHMIIDSVEKRKIFIMCMSIGTITCAKLYRKSFLVDNNIFYVEGLAYEDHMFALLLYLYAKNVLIINQLGYHYWVNPKSTVLTKNSTRHYEQLEVDDMTWNESIKRGFFDTYKEELEAYFLQIGFLAPLKNLPTLYESAPYDLFLKLKEVTLKKVPNYPRNRYINEYFTEFDKALLSLLSLDICEKDFQGVCEAIKIKKGIK